MDGKIDERRFRELLVESDDLQSDAMKTAHTGLNSYVDAAAESRYERRRELGIGGAILGAGALGAAALAFAGPASAASSKDVMALQTAASIEVLAIGTYKTALTLDFIGGGSANPIVKAFAMKTMAQHTDHLKGFNAAVGKLGGKPQHNPDPKYAQIVNKAVPTIKGAPDVVGLAITLEDVAAQTYVKNVGQVSTPELRGLFLGVAGVEAQHKAILLAVQALLKGGLASQIKLPPDAGKLPAAAGKVGFPDGFYPVKMASPVSEGAVK
ncbi:MAG: ferritin-like domain-containing protein [Jatrophihabitantaceae bacterium]